MPLGRPGHSSKTLDSSSAPQLSPRTWGGVPGTLRAQQDFHLPHQEEAVKRQGPPVPSATVPSRGLSPTLRDSVHKA